MAFCNTCGALLEDNAKFCQTCGAAVENAAPPVQQNPAAPAAPPQAPPVFNQAPPAQQYQAPPPPPPAAEGATNVFDPKDIEDNKIMAVLAYIIFLVPLIAAKESPFARFHTNQGFVLFLGWLLCGVVNIVPILGLIASAIGGLLVLVLSVIGIINSAKGEAKELPIIGNIKLLK